MAINSRQKGRRGEAELAKILRETYGFEEARRGQQFSGANGDADVIGITGIHIECKYVERLNIFEAYEQSCRDAKAENEFKQREAIPTVFHRKNHKPWLVTMGLEDFIKLYRSAME